MYPCSAYGAAMLGSCEEVRVINVFERVVNLPMDNLVDKIVTTID